MHIIAGDPIAADDELVRSANAQELSVVLVELWPQADWTRLFVLTPFVVECEAGHGFPVREIADRLPRRRRTRGCSLPLSRPSPTPLGPESSSSR